jgi:hypothetical protein
MPRIVLMSKEEKSVLLKELNDFMKQNYMRSEFVPVDPNDINNLSHGSINSANHHNNKDHE